MPAFQANQNHLECKIRFQRRENSSVFNALCGNKSNQQVINALITYGLIAQAYHEGKINNFLIQVQTKSNYSHRSLSAKQSLLLFCLNSAPHCLAKNCRSFSSGSGLQKHKYVGLRMALGYTFRNFVFICPILQMCVHP